MASLFRFQWLALIVLVAGMTWLGAPAPARSAPLPPLPSKRLAARSAPHESQLPAYIKASNTGAGDWFGHAVALDGDTMVVGAPYEDSAASGINGDQQDNSIAESGAAYVYVRSGDGWIQQSYLKASNPGVGDFFGWSVAIAGDTIVVGEPGAAYVFVRSNGSWSQQAYLKSSAAAPTDLFGYDVDVSGDTIVVGAYGESSSASGVNGDQEGNGTYESGAAYVFVRSEGAWSQQAYLKASNTNMNDIFGISSAISGDTIVIGSQGEASASPGVNGDQQDNSAPNAGAAYVFVRSEGVWSQQAYLKASNPDAVDMFGFAVGVDGERIVVGALYESSAATGMNGDQQDNSLFRAGAAYVFERTGASWIQRSYVKARHPDSDDAFGVAVAIDGDTAVVGALGESSAAAEVNGDQHDNSAAQAGAAYVVPLASSVLYLPMLTTPAMPDLVGSIALSPDSRVFAAGDPVRVTVTITNTGDAPSAPPGPICTSTRPGRRARPTRPGTKHAAWIPAPASSGGSRRSRPAPT